VPPILSTFNHFVFFELYVFVSSGEMSSGNRSSAVEKTCFMDIYNRVLDLHVKQGCSFEITSKVVFKEFDEEFKQAYRCSLKSSKNSPSPQNRDSSSS
jgi:hypothetical protein